MLITKLTPRGFLSFPPDFPGIELGPLNVLIGPNGCGKSNMIEVISAYRNMTAERIIPSTPGGTADDWIWRGDSKPNLSLEAEIINDDIFTQSIIRHKADLIYTNNRSSLLCNKETFFESEDENCNIICEYIRHVGIKFSYTREKEEKFIPSHDRNRKEKPDNNPSVFRYSLSNESVYSIRNVAETLKLIRIYTDWGFGRNAPARQPQAADAEADFLMEDFSNFGVVLHSIKDYPDARKTLIKYLRLLNPGVIDFDVRIAAGFVQIIIEEERLGRIPATRLSDGTLRYLALLTVLCHPKPPPLVVLEEPELGLHPDVVIHLGDLLREASERTQLVVTTHSELLIDSFSETPEHVIACDKVDGGTVMKRLEKEPLREWLEEYSLGRLWARGHLGANT